MISIQWFLYFGILKGWLQNEGHNGERNNLSKFT
jgi:hypothetical protein